ncbi:hypothetical protein HWD96_04225 [Pseudomonas putida]|uniref:hypothetical protein n=1 Tax=Pseudomonas putida TaxID=303 RepID=UPI001F5267EB|nr:hypothetical protein [Pseudomonas putida]MCI1021432.1 hypothetical protein [Pseudomonas putida]
MIASIVEAPVPEGGYAPRVVWWLVEGPGDWIESHTVLLVQRSVTLEEYLDPVLIAETYSGLSLVQCEFQLFDEEIDEFLVSRHLVVGQLVLDVGEGLFAQITEDCVHVNAPEKNNGAPEEAPQGVVELRLKRVSVELDAAIEALQ